MRIHISSPTLLALALAAAPASAQAVHGRIVETGTGQPVGGAVVMLMNENGARVAATLTDAEGAYALRASADGTYTVRAQRVSYADAASSALSLRADAEVEQSLAMEPRGLVLEPLLVNGLQRECTIRPEGGAEAAVVWEELRKALDAAAVAEERQRYAFRKRLYRRNRTLSRRYVTDAREWGTEYSTEPFHTAPVERLARYGYVEGAGDSLVFHVPDAQTLLSDGFLDNHCFSLRERRGSVGLDFAPTADRTLPDIRGTLWLDRRTASLRRLEYTYVNLPYENPENALGGEVVFEQLPDGAWIVRRWVVRMPRFRVLQSGETYVPALIEQGGEVVGIRPAQ
jgi:hypothetical protein